MKILSAVLGRNGDSLWFFCPGCNHLHSVNVDAGHRPCWGWDGNEDMPTFTPSLLTRFPANPEAAQEHKEWRTERVCHCFIRSGHIQFLGDCTHGLAGKTVPLPPLPAYLTEPFQEDA